MTDTQDYESDLFHNREEKQILKRDSNRYRPKENRKRYRTMTPDYPIKRGIVNVNDLESRDDFRENDGGDPNAASDIDLSLDERYASIIKKLSDIEYSPINRQLNHIILAANKKEDNPEDKRNWDNSSIKSELKWLDSELFKKVELIIQRGVFNKSDIGRISSKLNKLFNLILNKKSVNQDIKRFLIKARMALFNKLIFEYADKFTHKRPAVYIDKVLERLDNAYNMLSSMTSMNVTPSKAYPQLIKSVRDVAEYSKESDDANLLASVISQIRLYLYIEYLSSRGGLYSSIIKNIRLFLGGAKPKQLRDVVDGIKNNDADIIDSIKIAIMHDLLFGAESYIIKLRNGQSPDELFSEINRIYKEIESDVAEKLQQKVDSMCGSLDSLATYDREIKNVQWISAKSITLPMIYSLVNYAKSICDKDTEKAVKIVKKDKSIISQSASIANEIMTNGYQHYDELAIDMNTASKVTMVNNALVIIMKSEANKVSSIVGNSKAIDAIIHGAKIDNRFIKSILGVSELNNDEREVFVKSLISFAVAEKIYEAVFTTNSSISSQIKSGNASIDPQVLSHLVKSTVSNIASKIPQWFKNMHRYVSMDDDDKENLRKMIRNLNKKDYTRDVRRLRNDVDAISNVGLGEMSDEREQRQNKQYLKEFVYKPSWKPGMTWNPNL